MFKSAYEKLGDIVWFPRMLEKVRLHAAGQLPEEYREYLGKGFDGRCIRFLGVEYEDVAGRVVADESDEAIFDWCVASGRNPSDEEKLVWNDFMIKRGWRDDGISSEEFQAYKTRYGLGHRDDILTYFDFYEVDEGRRE